MDSSAGPATPAEVDAYLVEKLLAPEPDLDAGRVRAHAAGLPHIEVSEVQGKFLMLLAEIASAKRVLEIGTLGGYSTTAILFVACHRPIQSLLNDPISHGACPK